MFSWRNKKNVNTFELKKNGLTSAMLHKIFSRRHFETFSLFAENMLGDFRRQFALYLEACFLEKEETICMISQSLFSGQ